MSDFKAKMHQIRFSSRLRSDPAGEAYSTPPDPIAVFKGLTSKGREGEEGRGREGKGKGRIGEGNGGTVGPPLGESGSASVISRGTS